jgi:glucose/arabinose dehydrogenase/mono/diheme cytochrome c family protein
VYQCLAPMRIDHLEYFVAFAVFLALPAPAALAQSGDRVGEVQTPPPAHLRSPPSPALTPGEALRTFRLHPGFRMEIVAAEPLVMDPVAMSFGPDGRLWVVEMRAFMPNVEGTGEDAPIGSIAVLTDTNGDGRMDQRIQFAGGLVMPRAVAPVANGALVAEPPNLWFYEDENGDGKADGRTLVADDYGDRSNPEHTANGLMWAMDNWIYSANHTVRFRYEQGKWRRESTVFRGQWGITQDDAGRLYYNTNSDPLRMDVMPADYLRRNANLVAPAGVNVQLARALDTPVWPARVTLGVNRGYRTLREDGTLPTVTAACGPVIYRGGAFPQEFSGNAFIAEPSANLVKRLLVDADGAVPTARNAHERTEFLASTDERFRPVNLHNGPDGALYVVDMYRGIIQHRIYLTTYLRNQIEERGLDAPVGLGRIYRIVPEGDHRQARPDLAKASAARLVATLEHREAWWRDTAQRLLVERRDPRTIPMLRKLVRQSRSSLARLHAAWTLDGIDGVDWNTVHAALSDADVDVAVVAARLSERFLEKDAGRTLQALEARAEWGEPKFLRQMALSLGNGPAGAVEPRLLRLATERGALPYMADAIVSSLHGRESAAFARLAGADTPGAAKVIASLSAAIFRSKDAAHIDTLLAPLASDETPSWLAESILAGIDRFIPGSRDQRRTAFIPAEPGALIRLSRQSTPLAVQAAEILRHLRWQGRAVDQAAALAALSPVQRNRYERGQREYAVCAACHQPGGEGMAGLAPPLVASPWVTGGVGALARIVLNGKTSADSTMPPLAALDDDTIAAILTYIRRSWGHEASAVDPSEVQAIRAEVSGRGEPWMDAELAPMR